MMAGPESAPTQTWCGLQGLSGAGVPLGFQRAEPTHPRNAPTGDALHPAVGRVSNYALCSPKTLIRVRGVKPTY
jgi:hypothetical protein